MTVLFFIIGGAIAFVGAYFFTYLFLDKFQPDKEISGGASFGITAGSAVIGGAVGYICAKYRIVGSCLFAAWGGICLGLLITTLFTVGHRSWAYSVIVFGCAIILVVLCVKFE